MFFTLGEGVAEYAQEEVLFIIVRFRKETAPWLMQDIFQGQGVKF